MSKKSDNLKNTYSWVGVGSAIGAIVFALIMNQIALR